MKVVKKIKVSDLSGQRFGRISVLRRSDKLTFGKRGPCHRHYVCLCDCGKQTEVLRYSLTSGNTKSCGCLHRELISAVMKKRKFIHGCTIKGHNVEYYAWKGMRWRCLPNKDPNHRNHINYYLRGIRVCPEWDNKDGFLSFYNHVGPKPSKLHSLDRIDNSLGYQPGNVRWADWKTQANNKRPSLRIEKFSDVAVFNECKKRGLISQSEFRPYAN